MILLACDQSVRGFATASAPTDWGGDWSKISTRRTDGGGVKRGDEYAALQRLWMLFGWVETQVCELTPGAVGFESYGFSSRPDTHVVELVGAIKLFLYKWRTPVETVQMSTARKLVAGELKVPRTGKDAKALMKQILISNGAPATLSADEVDALVVLNSMLVTHGGDPLCK